MLSQFAWQIRVEWVLMLCRVPIRDLQQHVFRQAAEAVGIYFEGFGIVDA